MSKESNRSKPATEPGTTDCSMFKVKVEATYSAVVEVSAVSPIEAQKAVVNMNPEEFPKFAFERGYQIGAAFKSTVNCERCGDSLSGHEDESNSVCRFCNTYIPDKIVGSVQAGT